MAHSTAYADLEIRILGRQEAGYPVEITLNPGQYYKRGFLTLPFPTWEDTRQASARLFTWLFEDPALKEAWECVRGQYPRRHIRLRLDVDVPELHALPWESLRDPATGLDLAGADATPFSRFLAGTWSPGSPIPTRPIKVLVAIADPHNLSSFNLAALDAEAEWKALQEATKELDVTLTRLPQPCTLGAIEAELRQGYHILHIVAHGAYRKGAVLYLADDNNQVEIVREDKFSAMLKRQLADSDGQEEEQLRLVFLASCESATRDTADAFRGLAPALVNAGVPAIVAMQDRISMSAAREFSRTFYRQLLQHGLVDLAGNQARAALLTASSSEAATPVVFMRLPDGKLWEISQLAVPARRDFYAHAPRLEPDRYVNRPHEYDQIKALLLGNATTVGITTVLRGAGGYGKTTLARVLCDDADIQARFSDGILWTTLGETPDLLPRLREWVTALGGIISEHAPTIPQLVNRLTDLLQDGAYFLLIDDVWDGADLTPFLCGGPRCGHLVTTRNRATLPADVQTVDVDTMRATEATAVLGYGLGAIVDTPEATSLQTLAQQLGYWPLLLGIINGVLRDYHMQEISLADALAYVAEGLAAEGLTAFDAVDAAERTRAVRATLDVSLNRLSPADRARYTELAIFPEDTMIPATAAARLWEQTGGLNMFKTKDMFRRLFNTSLVQAYDAGQQTVRLHDVVRGYLADALGLEGCATAHNALLTAYRSTQAGTVWHTAPDDGYLYAHLAYHLDALAAIDSDAAAELASLFATDTWLQARVAADDFTYDGYLSDMEYFWRRAEQNARCQIATGMPPDAMVECVRCALIRTTVNSLASNYVPKLVIRAVENGMWSLARALSMAAMMPDPEQRAQMYILLLKLDSLTETQRDGAKSCGMAAARAIEDELRRVDALAVLAPQLAGSAREQLLAEGVIAARVIKDERVRAVVLTALAPQLTGAVLADGLAAAREIENKYLQVRALTALAPQLAGSAREQLLAEGVATARVIKDEWVRVAALAKLAPQLTEAVREQVLAEGLATAREIKDELERADALTALVPQLTGPVREQALAEGLAAARVSEKKGPPAFALATLAPQLTGELLVEGLAAALEIENEQERTRVLTALTPQLTGKLLADGLAAALEIENEQERTRVLTALAPQLTGKLLADGLAAAREIENEKCRAAVLAILALQLTGAAQEQVLAECWAAIQEIEDEKDQVQILAELASQLTGAAQEQVLKDGLATARMIKDEYEQVQALAALPPQSAGKLRLKVLAAVWSIKEKEWARTLAALPWRLIRALFAAASAVLAPKLGGMTLKQASADGLAEARTIENEVRRANELAMLVPRLTGELLEEGLATAREIRKAWCRAQVLVALLPYLSSAAVKPVKRDYQAAILAELHAVENAKREDVLRLLGSKDVFKPDALGLTPAAAVRIAQAIEDVCQQWEWL